MKMKLNKLEKIMLQIDVRNENTCDASAKKLATTHKTLLKEINLGFTQMGGLEDEVDITAAHIVEITNPTSAEHNKTNNLEENLMQRAMDRHKVKLHREKIKVLQKKRWNSNKGYEYVVNGSSANDINKRVKRGEEIKIRVGEEDYRLVVFHKKG